MTKKLPLGLRNNNPLNIIYDYRNKWAGQTGSNGGKCVFTTKAYGFRAAFRLLDHYVVTGYNTLRHIIYRWAPPSDGNNTSGYLFRVCAGTGYDPDKVVRLRGNRTFACALALEMARVELGEAYLYDDIEKDINAGYTLAFNEPV